MFVTSNMAIARSCMGTAKAILTKWQRKCEQNTGHATDLSLPYAVRRAAAQPAIAPDAAARPQDWCVFAIWKHTSVFPIESGGAGEWHSVGRTPSHPSPLERLLP